MKLGRDKVLAIQINHVLYGPFTPKYGGPLHPNPINRGPLHAILALLC